MKNVHKSHCNHPKLWAEKKNSVKSEMKQPGWGNTHHTDILEHLNDGWVHEIVAGPIVEEGLDDGLKEKVPHDVAIVEFILQTNDPPHEAQGTWLYGHRDQYWAPSF